MTTDKQLIGMAGEFLTAGKLYKLGLQACVTLGNAKSVDILAFNPTTNKSFNVQVKTQKGKNRYPISWTDVKKDFVYVFVRLNGINQNEEFFIIKGETLLNNQSEFWGASLQPGTSTIAGINYGPVDRYKDKWDVFTN